MTKWKYNLYESIFSFEENVILNNHISDDPKDFEKSVASKAKREVGKGSKNIKVYERALRNLENIEYLNRWISPNKFNHYSVITEKGLGFREDNKGLVMWASNKWIGLPDKYSDTLTFMILSSWRFDRHLRSQELNVQINTEYLVRRFGNTWSEKDIKKRIQFLKNNGNLNGNMLSELTFSPELEEVYSYDEMK